LRLSWRDVGLGALGGLAAIFVGAILAGLTIAIFGEVDSAAAKVAEDLLRQGDRRLLVTMAVLVLVGAPIVEEMAFRGSVDSSASKRGWVPWVTIPLSALAFALFHFEPQRLLILFGIGVVLGVVRWKTRSLGACMVAHGINNLPAAIYIATLT
jgi:membrane protease YdiL (CAAX protease family)